VKRTFWIGVVHTWILQGAREGQDMCFSTPCPVKTGVLNLSQVGWCLRMIQFSRGAPNCDSKARHLEQRWSDHGSWLPTSEEVAKQESKPIRAPE